MAKCGEHWTNKRKQVQDRKCNSNAGGEPKYQYIQRTKFLKNVSGLTVLTS